MPVADDAFAALAHPMRRAILEQLGTGEQPAMQLAADFDVTPGALSQHLKVLRDAGLVSRRRDGRQQLYSVEPAPLQEVAQWLDRWRPFWERRFDALEAYLETKHGRQD